ILGHNFSPFLKFKGGKGISTSLGTLIAIAPMVGLIAFGLWATATDLTSAAEGALQALLEQVITGLAPAYRGEAAASVAIIGMGKLGGRELSYLSDWDLLFVYDERAPKAAEIANRVAEKVISAAPELRARDAMVEIDARLRPEGRFGALARGIDGYLQYYEQSAQTWERQALIRARPIAGSARTARRWLKITRSYVYRRPLSENELIEIQAMKYRVETERVDKSSPDINLKLGPGGMSDIEFLVQARQLQYGCRAPQCRKQNTIAALRALQECGALSDPDAAMLEEAYLYLNRLRGHLQLRSGTGSECLPENRIQRRPIALAWGLPDSERVPAEDRLFNQTKMRMQEVRRIYERLFLHQKV
ncbi:MAG: glycerol-3-phosphate acyltransferase, partial [Armatimonadetes bacterium]|nr:glycerol-3-phosphate acyltransferase [Armatimonadota bacterium]